MDWREAHRMLLQDKDRRKAYKKVDLGFEIGKMVADGRIARKMTQQKLAELIGTQQPSIARLEKGNYLPSFGFLQKIAKALSTQLLPPRLEFLEARKLAITLTPTIVVHKQDLSFWSLTDSSAQWSGVRKVNINADKELEYAHS